MVKLGYSLSSEEHTPDNLVRYARQAEQAGFTFAMISDHFHPWIDRQGQSPFVWAVIGGIAQVTRHLQVSTGVTCPIMRIHPAIIAQAAATTAAMMPGRFMLGVGTGENLNEHILGQHWPPADVRQEMLEEAIEVIRGLWKGKLFSHRGKYFTVENARIYTLPEQPPPILVAASGPESAELAGRTGDGLISVSPQAGLISRFEAGGGAGKPRYGQVTVCWAETEEQARRIAHTWWPTAALRGSMNSELALPEYFEEAARLVTEEQVAQAIVCGPDPQKHLDRINEYVRAGFDHIYIHQVGPDQEGFMNFYQREILPHFQ
jgi:G6PDH family F420-dependent oxidoreductase